MLGSSDRPTAYGNDAADTPLSDGSGGNLTYTSPLVTSGAGAAPAHFAAPAVKTVPAKVKGGGALGLVGCLTVVLGAWAGIIPYAGPVFSFGATGTPSWTWDLLHSGLWLAPGALAVLCGLIIVGKVPSVSYGRGGALAGLAGFLVVLSGAWLAIGPLAWPVLKHGAVFTSGTAWRDFLTRLAYSYGPAILLAMLGGLAMGLVVGKRVKGVAKRVKGVPVTSSTIPVTTATIPTASSQPF